MIESDEFVEELWAKVDRKPDSVVTPNMDHSDHSSCPLIARRGRATLPEGYGRTTQPSYLVLLQVGFAMRPSLLVDR